MSGAPEVRVYDKLVHLGRPLAPLPRGTVPGGGVHGLVRPCKGEADDGVGMQRDEERATRGRGGGQGGLPAAGEQLLGDALGCQCFLSHEGTPGTDLQTSNSTFVAALGGPHGTVRGSVHRPMT